MSDRLYFAATRNSEVSPDPGAFVYDVESGEYPRQLSRSKLGDSPQSYTMHFATGQNAKHFVFVSPPVQDQMLSGTFTCQIQVNQSNADDNCQTRIEIYVVNSRGEFRGTLAPSDRYGPSTEYHTSLRNKQFADGDALNALHLFDGDRIVVIIGHSDLAGTDPISATVQLTDLPALSDLGTNETDTALMAPWIEFSQNILWADQTTGSEATISQGFDEINPETIDDHIPPIDEPKIPPPPPWYPIEFPNRNIPGNALPFEGTEEYIYLVKVEGDPNSGFVFRDHRLLSKTYKQLEWWYHRIGGCGSLRLLTRESEIVADVANDRAWQWEIHCRIRLPGQLTGKTWYRGIVNQVTSELSGNELLTDVRGVGYSHLLNRIWVSRRYPPKTPIRTILSDLIDDYIIPNTTIRRADPVDVTNGGIDEPTYVTKGDISLECSVFKALKIIAELEGNVEWGVDADRNFYWRRENSTVGMGFVLDKHTTYIRGGHYSAERINKVRVDALPLGSTEYQWTRGDITDITDITSKGEHNIVAEAPWFGHPSDAAHWADNIIIVRRKLLHWRLVGWDTITRRLEDNHPIRGLDSVYWRDGNDATIGFSRYLIDKIHYFKGGFNLPEVKEKGRVGGRKFLAPAEFRAEVYLGNTPKEIGEILEGMGDQVEALKSRNRIRRNPRDVTDITNPSRYRDVTGNIPGEIVHVRSSAGNMDYPNSSSELQDVTNPRGVLLAWLSKQWHKISIRRTVTSLPSRGYYIGEVISLYTDLTNLDEGTLYWWNGTAWSLLTQSSSVNGGIIAFGANIGGTINQSLLPWQVPSTAAGAQDSFTVRIEASRAGTLRNLRVRTSTTVAISAVTFTVRVNGSNTALSATITVGNANGVDTTNSVSVNAGDLIELTISAAGNTNRLTYAVLSYD